MPSPKPLRKTEALSDAAQLYKRLVKDIGRGVNSYDLELITELAGELGAPDSESIESFITEKKISPEDFLRSFFKAGKPLALMMKDVLKTFEQSGAQHGDSNIKIKFNFSKQQEHEFDLTHFREWMEIWERVQVRSITRRWSTESIWKLFYVLRDRNITGNRNGINGWLSEYEDRRRWPSALPAQPVIGHQELDEQIDRIWRLVDDLIRTCRKYGPERSDLGSPRAEAADTDQEAETDDGQERISLARIDHDIWFSQIITFVRGIPDYIARMSPDRVDEACRDIASDVKKIFDDTEEELDVSESMERRLEEFLNLPIWRQRHELYSVWVGCQFANVLGHDRIALHTASGLLSFSFRGVHLGTWQREPVPLYLWCEVRSPLEKPSGAGRKKAIQPDYRAIPAPMSSPELCEIVVECKQYWLGNAREFSEAINDYARGCPHAGVVLVNYGKVPASTSGLIEHEFIDRVALIENFRPGIEEGKKKFRDFISDKIGNPKPEFPTASPNPTQIAGPVTVTLNWGASPRDLDLHSAVFLQSADSIDVSFPQKGQMIPVGRGNIFYHKDVTAGFGPEQVDLHIADPGIYMFYVHQYSSDSNIQSSAAKVTIDIGGRRQSSWICPSSGSGRYWYVFALIVDANGARILEVNRITDERPEDLIKNVD